MKARRFSVLTLVVVVACCGLGFMALRSSSPLWYNAIYTFTIVLLLVAVILARYQKGSVGAFWFGLAVFGWGFFFLGSQAYSGQFSQPNFMGRPAEILNEEFFSSKIILFLVKYLRSGTDDLEEIDAITVKTTGILYLMTTLAFATIGGLVAVLAHRFRRSRGLTQSKIPSSSIMILLGLILVSIPAWLDDFSRPQALPVSAPAIEDDVEISERNRQFAEEFRRKTGEPPLWMFMDGDRPRTSYSLYWSPAFGHTVYVRVTRSPDEIFLRVIVFEEIGEFDENIAIDRQVRLSEHQWDELESRVEKANFWGMPIKDPDEESGCDGENLIIKGVKHNQYHKVKRWSPKDPAFLELCRYLLESTGLKTSETWRSWHQTDPKE